MSFCMGVMDGHDGDLHTAMAELRQDCDKGAKEVRHMSRQENDAVAHPSHYTQGEIECIDAMESALTHEEFVGYLRANVLKYIWRYDHKGAPVQDLLKARWYLDRLIGEVGRDEDQVD